MNKVFVTVPYFVTLSTYIFEPFYEWYIWQSHSFTMITITKAGHHGILLPELNIGLDYSGSKADHIFISHAHADHMPRNRSLTVYCTRPTSRFMKLRGFTGKMIEMDFEQPLETDHARITLFPAGHILGSAMTFIESDKRVGFVHRWLSDSTLTGYWRF